MIAERARTHGSFEENTKFMQTAKDLARAQPGWSRLRPFQREGIDMIMHKIGRVLHGDPDFVDHWDDVAGYAERVAKTLRGES